MPALEAVPVAPLEVRQRWRVTYRRRSDAPRLPQREQLAAWEVAIAVSGLPLAGLDLANRRPRLVFAAPLAEGVGAERELLDLFLVSRLSVAEVRVRLLGSLPAGHDLVEVHDVWLGEPALSGQVVAADYRLSIETADGAEPDRSALESACERLLAASTLPAARDKGGRSVPYDLRPLIADVTVLDLRLTGAGEPPIGSEPPTGLQLRIRTLFDPARGVGRPDEVLAALSGMTGEPLVAPVTVRERLILARD
ncbi:MAG: hypothetical protein HW391_405 [Chloroflexi bacterium]|nr:hypothetical protein [Chloroflexota bacterium]